MTTANRIVRRPLFIAGVFILAAIGTGSSSAQQGTQHAALQTDLQPLQDNAKPRIQVRKPRSATAVAATDPAAAVAATDPATPEAIAKPGKRPQSARGPYYVDFRARTAASYGHAFVWYGKTSEKKVDVAGLHPAGDEVPYILGHLMWVPSETGASYGDLDPQYLTANYRVYLNEADAKKVFAYIKHLQATSPLWNAQTTNCTAFIGRIATYMGLKAPFHLQRPENYINELRVINGGRQTAQLAPDAERY